VGDKELVNHPSHYASACRIGRKVLRRFSTFAEADFDRECDLVMVEYGWHENAYLYNAAKYLWRCESKGALMLDLKKAHWFLNRWKEVWLLTTHAECELIDCDQVESAIDTIDFFLATIREVSPNA
jgi:Protein of unknwon function (DUF3310)